MGFKIYQGRSNCVESFIKGILDTGSTPVNSTKKEINAVIRIKKEAALKVKLCSELNPVISNANPRIKNKVGTEYFFRSRPMFSIVKILII